jgi:hypothetical protein
MFIPGPNAKKMRAIEDARKPRIRNTTHPGNNLLSYDATT